MTVKQICDEKFIFTQKLIANRRVSIECCAKKPVCLRCEQLKQRHVSYIVYLIYTPEQRPKRSLYYVCSNLRHSHEYRSFSSLCARNAIQSGKKVQSVMFMGEWCDASDSSKTISHTATSHIVTMFASAFFFQFLPWVPRVEILLLPIFPWKQHFVFMGYENV